MAVFNDDGELEKSFKDVYPQDCNLKGFFLGLCIKIRDNRFPITFYDKRDGFPFFIVRMPYLYSNTKIFYSAFGAEILRIARATSTCN